MTLILAIPTSEGILFASDGQVTSGEIRFSGQKLYELNTNCAWAASGELALIQRVHEVIGGVSADQPLDRLRDELATAIKQCVNSLLQLDFRTPFFVGRHEALLSLHPGDFVFVEARTQPKILHITSHGTPEWIHRPFATGSGAVFAYALLRKYQGIQLSMDQATLLAFKVIQEAIDVGAYGLGPPIEVRQVLPSGLRSLDEPEIAALNDAAGQLRDSEIQLLLEVTRRPNEEAPNRPAEKIGKDRHDSQ
jgi:proteasome beta subunit